MILILLSVRTRYAHSSSVFIGASLGPVKVVYSTIPYISQIQFIEIADGEEIYD